MEATAQIKDAPSRHYFYRKVLQPESSSSASKSNNSNSTAFEDRVNEFINKSSVRATFERINAEAEQDLARRKADRKARKEKEQLAARASSNDNSKSINKATTNHNAEEMTTDQHELFTTMSSLTPVQQNAWLANIHDDAMLMNPHQWLKLASLFNVNSKATRIQSFLNIEHIDTVLEDRGIAKEDIRPLESFLELRDIQNRNYARDAVHEGVKLFKQHKLNEAMDFYKRALDMDSKYADGWYHVAECLLQQKKLADAEEHLERALKHQPDHEEAKALLASIQRKTKPQKQDEWDLVDEYGESINKKTDEEKTSHKKSRDIPIADVDQDKDISKTRERKPKTSRRSRSRDSVRDGRESRRRRHRSSDRSSSKRRGRSNSRQRDSSKHSRRIRRRSVSREDRRSERSKRHRHREDDYDKEVDRRRRRSRSRDDGRSSKKRKDRSRSREKTSNRRHRSRVEDEARSAKRRRGSRDAERSPARRSRQQDGDDASSKRQRDSEDNRSKRIEKTEQDTHRSSKRKDDD